MRVSRHHPITERLANECSVIPLSLLKKITRVTDACVWSTSPAREEVWSVFQCEAAGRPYCHTAMFRRLRETGRFWGDLSPLNKGTKHGALQSSWWNPRSPRCRWLVWGEKLNGVLSSCKEPRRETTRHPEINPDPNNFFFFLFFMKLMLYSSFKSRTLLTTFLLPLFNHSMRS